MTKSEEAKARKAAKMREWRQTPEGKAAQAERQRKRRKTPEGREKADKKTKNWWLSARGRERKKEYDSAYRNDPLNKVKIAARKIVGIAVSAGILIRMPCTECGDLETQAHHNDYFKPLDVEWLCRKCHMGKYHSQESK